MYRQKLPFQKTLVHLLISGCYLNTANAQIIADYSAPAQQRPAVLKGKNGQPLIHIQTPNAQGLSHNRYSQFDVDSKGVVLNNQRNSNPYLAKGTAKVILNEVRSDKASRIQGNIQVAGNKADVIVANPAGISINGGGVQHARNAVFTSGQVQQKNGKIQHINVQNGRITVGNKGLNSQADYTQLIARAVDIQGKLSAGDVVVSSGRQNADYQKQQFVRIKEDGKGKPQVGIDTGALGGMYAGSIRLIANEQGVGVRNAGTLNAKQTLWIDSFGKIEQRGNVQTGEKLVMRTHSAGSHGDMVLHPSSKISGNAEMWLVAGGHLQQQGTITQTGKSEGIHLTGQKITLKGSSVSTANPLTLTATRDGIYLEPTEIKGTGKLTQALTNKQNQIKRIDGDIQKEKQRLSQDTAYIKLQREYHELMTIFHRTGQHNLGVLAEAEKRKKALDTYNNATKLDDQKKKTQREIAALERDGDTQTYRFSQLKGSEITFNANGGLSISGANIRAEKSLNAYVYGSLPNGKTISIQGATQMAESGGGNDYRYATVYQPSVLSAKQHIRLNALQTTGKNSVEIKGSRLHSDSGRVSIFSYGDVDLSAGKDEFYRYHHYTEKTEKWYKRRTITLTHESQIAYAVPTQINSKNGISIRAGNHLNLYASQLNAPSGKIDLTAGKQLKLYAVDELDKHSTNAHTQKRLLGIKTGSSHYAREQIINAPLPTKLVAQSAHLKSGWHNVLQGTQFRTLSGAKIEAGVGEKARKDAKIFLQGVKSRVHTEERKRGSHVVWQTFQGKGQITESLILPTFQGGNPIFNASGGIVVDVPKGKLRDELSRLLKKPEYAYLKTLKANNEVQWNEIALAYQHWNYKQQGLTEAGAALVALAMAVATSGTGASIMQLTNTSYATMANVAFTSLATQATTTLINHQGNIGQSLKALGSQEQIKQFAATVISAGVADKLVGAANISTGKELLDTLGNNLISAGSTAVVQAGLNGGKVTKALENAIYTALIDTAHAELAKNIKGIKNQADANKWYREAAHKIAHAVAGCGAAAGKGGKCSDGALGAALGEVVGELFTKNKTRNEIDEIEIVNKTKLIVGSVAATLGKDVNMSVAAAHIAVKFNTVNKDQAGDIEKFRQDMNNSKSQVGLKKGKEAEDILIKFSNVDRTLSPNFVTGFNTSKSRYIYTEKEGWIDMNHFLFYAGIAYETKKELLAFNRYSSRSTIENKAINRAVAYGYVQEIIDMVRAKHSAFEYEDLVSDKQGAIFGAKYFDPKSSLNIGQQVKLYFEKELKATKPNTAPNYHQLPPKDIGKHSGVKNYTTSPLFTK